MDILNNVTLYSLYVPILYLLRMHSGLFNPIRLMVLFWLIQLFVVSLFGDFFILHYTGFYFILALLFCFEIGGIAGNRLALPSSYESVLGVCPEKRILILLVILILLAFVHPLITVLKYGFSISTLLNATALLEMNNAVSVDRYSGHSSTSLLTQILLVFTYVAPLYAGYVYRLGGTKIKRISVIAIIPGVFVALTQAVKMAFITSSFLWVSGYMACSLLYGLYDNLSLRKVFRITLFVVLALGILFVSMMFRTGHFDMRTAELISHKFITYAFGHLPAFDNWFSLYDLHSGQYTYGGKTFYGISNFLGIIDRKQGVFTDFCIIDTIHSKTNIYTVFRLLIEDFGIIGTCVYITIIGALSAYIFRMVKLQVCPHLSVTLLTSIFFSISWSFVTSVFAYTSYLLMFFLFYILVKITTSYVEK